MADQNSSGMFAAPKQQERSVPIVPVAIAAVIVLVSVTFAFVMGRRDGQEAAKLKTLQPVAAYAANLKLEGLAMSEAASYSGAKATYIDGTITNTGSQTVNDVTVQVVFHIAGGADKVEATPLMLIRAREPYIDVQPVSAAPLAPGKGAEFRLTFETVDPGWDQQLPEVRVVRVASK